METTILLVICFGACFAVFHLYRRGMLNYLKDDLQSSRTYRNELIHQIREVYRDCHRKKQILEGYEIENSVVICGNGHRHRYKSFEYAYGNIMDYDYEISAVAERTTSTGTTSVNGTVVSTFEAHGNTHVPYVSHNASSKIVTRRGCPTCKTTLASFENSSLHNYILCTKCEDSPSSPSPHWKIRNEPCPYCNSPIRKSIADLDTEIRRIESQINRFR